MQSFFKLAGRRGLIKPPVVNKNPYIGFDVGIVACGRFKGLLNGFKKLCPDIAPVGCFHIHAVYAVFVAQGVVVKHFAPVQHLADFGGLVG